jgi:hypothetical protein
MFAPPTCWRFVFCWLAVTLLVICAAWSERLTTRSEAQADKGDRGIARAVDLIYRQKYNDAITQLEQILEHNPRNVEAMTYMATANLYHDLNFTRAKTEFEDAFKAGGGATFFVTHSHEKVNTDMVDYCRGWLHLRSNGIEFVPLEGDHSFKWKYDEIEEFKTNRLSKFVFHIKTAGKSQNFRGRSNSELEPILIIALYKSFTRN